MLVMRSKPNRRKNAGESMLVVVMMMLVFFLLGVAVLTAASAATGIASARIMERQGYYYARSMMDTLDASLQEGLLGRALEKAIVEDVKGEGITGGSIMTRTYTKTEPFILVFTPTFSDVALSELNGSDDAEAKNLVTINCVGRAYVTLTNGKVTAYTLDMRQLTVTYDCAYRSFVTRAYIRYKLTCRRDGYDETDGSDSSHNIQWDIKGAG